MHSVLMQKEEPDRVQACIPVIAGVVPQIWDSIVGVARPSQTKLGGLELLLCFT